MMIHKTRVIIFALAGGPMDPKGITQFYRAGGGG